MHALMYSAVLDVIVPLWTFTARIEGNLWTCIHDDIARWRSGKW